MAAGKEFDVAVSFADEDRPYVERVVRELQRLGARVFYHPDRIVELWGKDRVVEGKDVFQDRSRAAVVFVSRHYVNGEWTRIELRNALARAMRTDDVYMLPARFDDTPLPGLPDTVHYVDCNAMAPEELARMVVDKVAVRAASVVADRRQRWRPDVYPPSALLRAEFEVVPFYGRTDVLEDLRTWAASDRQVGVRVYTGAGGMGKTRLMTEFCRQLGDEGWLAGFLNRATGGPEWPVALDSLFKRHRLLLVIDYAETRQGDVVATLQRAVDAPASGRARIVLLARSLGDWWFQLTALEGRAGEVLNGPATGLVSMRPLAPDATERRRLFDQAATAFGGVVPGAHRPAQPSLEARHYDRALYVLITALAAVHGDAVETEGDLLDWALRRERQFLDDGVASLVGGQLRGRPILQCAAVATLAGRTNSRAEAAELLSSSAPLLGGQPAAVVDAIAELLHRLYPGEAWLEGVQPDLLGEHLVERALLEDRGLLGAVFGSAE